MSLHRVETYDILRKAVVELLGTVAIARQDVEYRGVGHKQQQGYEDEHHKCQKTAPQREWRDGQTPMHLVGATVAHRELSLICEVIPKMSYHRKITT